MKLLTGMWEYVVCYRVGRNYHLCGNWAKTSRMNLNNDWEKYSPEIYIQGRKKGEMHVCSEGERLPSRAYFSVVRNNRGCRNVFYCIKKLLLTSCLLSCRKNWAAAVEHTDLCLKKRTQPTRKPESRKQFKKNTAACAAPCSAIDLSASVYLDLQFKLGKS